MKSEQPEAAREFVKGQDVFASLPTGSGKSLCYGCLPLVYNSLCGNFDGNKSIVIVVSPLKALMQTKYALFVLRVWSRRIPHSLSTEAVAHSALLIPKFRRFLVSSIFLQQSWHRLLRPRLMEAVAITRQLLL